MIQEIQLEKWRSLKERGELVTVDVRSPSEFRMATIPGSVNIPLFDDAERAEVGTLYKQEGVECAKKRGLEIVSAKLPAFIESFAIIPGPKTVFCWRGGMRSKTSATLLSLMGMQASRLTGGYRAYRQWVVKQLEEMEYDPRAVVIHGLTGCGKTEILRRLEAAGYPVLDLEGMAGHRGSRFGGIGTEARNQKMFDALLLERLLETKDKPAVAFEAESRRIGKIMVPDLIAQRKASGLIVRIELPMEERVQHLLHDYKPWEHHEESLQAFQLIRSKIHIPIAQDIQANMERGLYDQAIELILEHYYDLKYEHSALQYGKDADYVVKARTVDEAYAQTEELMRTLQS